MTPQQAYMLRGILQISRGSPGYGGTTLRSIAVDADVLILGVITEGRNVSLHIPYLRFTMMDGNTFTSSPYRFGELLAMHLDEEIDTGLVATGNEDTILVDPS